MGEPTDDAVEPQPAGSDADDVAVAEEAPGAEPGADPTDEPGEAEAAEALEAELFGGGADVAAERDEYRDALLRVKADFENYKKRIAKDHAATVERAAEKLVSDLLPVLDACDAAIAHGAADVEPIAKSLADTLGKEGLERIDPVGAVFDPERHEAVLHEPDDDGAPETVVVESLRVGYAWKGRVIRPAMVKVKG